MGDILVEVGRLPEHIAIVMDGNGRWANRLGMPRTDGHRRGSDAVRTVTRACRRLGVRALTLYAFSEQNWDRPPTEVDALMALLREFLIRERREILDNNIRLRAVGRVDRLPATVRDVLDTLEAESRGNTGMTLTLALSYG
ncbi:MAG: di-trans,poly-cis-decaprenylcistransferase, partial [Myxococcales bacterium]|nr:di-trans,poly-cis-decaprenylcistransferase [Myxococcales bacterium]